MSCLFPGMDPYLDEPKIWPQFQHQLITCIYQMILPGLVDRYRAKIVTRNYQMQTALFTSVITDEYTEESIEIRYRADGHLVTLIEMVSPANRSLTIGREAYLKTRTAAIQQKASIVEIDLVLQGQPTLDFNRDGLPAHDYTVTVTRGASPERYEIYTANLQKRLPKFKLPLAADDRDTVADLQIIFNRAYELGQFSSSIDYSRQLPADWHLSAELRTWISETLSKHKS